MAIEHDATLKGVLATGPEARAVRRRLNVKYGIGEEYLHEWHPMLQTLSGEENCLVLGMDVAGFPRNIRNHLASRGLHLNGKVVGVDFSPSRIRELQVEFRADPRYVFLADDPVLLAFADATESPFDTAVPSRDFDIALCTYALHDRDVRDPEKALHGLARALRETGFALVVTHARGSFPELKDFYAESCEMTGMSHLASQPFTHFDNFAEEDAPAKLLKFFSHVSYKEMGTSLVFPRDASQPRTEALEDFLSYCDYFPFPGLNHVQSEDDRHRIRAGLAKLASHALEESAAIRITKPCKAFLCRSPLHGDR